MGGVTMWEGEVPKFAYLVLCSQELAEDIVEHCQLAADTHRSWHGMQWQQILRPSTWKDACIGPCWVGANPSGLGVSYATADHNAEGSGHIILLCGNIGQDCGNHALSDVHTDQFSEQAGRGAPGRGGC